MIFVMGRFLFQSEKNPVYKSFVDMLGIKRTNVKALADIPFLPVSFFKTHKVKTFTGRHSAREAIFTSSGTTGTTPSRHAVADIALYKQSILNCFERFYGSIRDYCILALIPERKNSSLVFMTDYLIKKTKKKESGFYYSFPEKIPDVLLRLEKSGRKTILLGLSYTLLDFCKLYPMKLQHTIIMETGGMKGKREEMTREELHAALCDGFGTGVIHSEYGMTELLSQAYSQGGGIFRYPPWMKIIVKDKSDPFAVLPEGQTGIINIVDLANVYSCSFIETGDLGRVYNDGTFEVLGRADNADIRGCNLMVNEDFSE